MTELSNNHPIIEYSSKEGRLSLKGAWTVVGLAEVETELSRCELPRSGKLVVDAAGITALDTAGALLLYKIAHQMCDSAGVTLQGLPPEQLSIYELVSQYGKDETPTDEATANFLERIGRAVVSRFRMAGGFLSFIGLSTLTLLKAAKNPRRFRWRSMAYHLESCGFDALPVIGLLTFLIGIVAAYQGGVQLQQFGASIYITDLVGLSITREFAPLITAILVAGRTGSAFTAQIATMKVTEEIDALRVLGLDPVEVLVLPKLAALLIVMPLLIIYADIMGIAGGMLMASGMLDVSASSFLARFPQAVSLTSYLIGISKAPVFAIIITMVGCYQGLLATGSAENVGVRTTTSVVQAIFLIIIADALFSVLFSWAGV